MKYLILLLTAGLLGIAGWGFYLQDKLDSEYSQISELSKTLDSEVSARHAEQSSLVAAIVGTDVALDNEAKDRIMEVRRLNRAMERENTAIARHDNKIRIMTENIGLEWTKYDLPIKFAKK